MHRGLRMHLSRAALGAIVAAVVSTMAATAQAKPWPTWATLAPDPLASDSSYAALSALPEDSLSTGEFSWLGVQRDWRRQRRSEARGETPGLASTVTEVGNPHRDRPGDKRFARLASRPYVGLSESDRAWLIVENAAHNEASGISTGGKVVGGILIAGILGAALAVAVVGYAFGHAFRFP